MKLMKGIIVLHAPDSRVIAVMLLLFFAVQGGLTAVNNDTDAFGPVIEIAPASGPDPLYLDPSEKNRDFPAISAGPGHESGEGPIAIDGVFYEWAPADILKLDPPDILETSSDLPDPSSHRIDTDPAETSPKPGDNAQDSGYSDIAGGDLLALYSRLDIDRSILSVRLDFVDIASVDWSRTCLILLCDIDPGDDSNDWNIYSFNLPGKLGSSRDPLYKSTEKIIVINYPGSGPRTATSDPSRGGFSNLVLSPDGTIGTLKGIAADTSVSAVELAVEIGPGGSRPGAGISDAAEHPLINAYLLYDPAPGVDDVRSEDAPVGWIYADSIETYNADGPLNPAPAQDNGDYSIKIAFIQHGNQPYRATDWNGNPDWIDGIVYDPEGTVDHDNGIADGYLYGLKAHEDFRIPMDLELTGTLLGALQYENTQFLERIRRDIKNGIVEPVGTVYSQQKLPYYPEDMNEWAIKTARDMIHDIIDPYGELGVDPKVMWVPDRTWNDSSNVVLPVARYYSAIVLDDRPHYDDFHSGASDDYHYVHRMVSDVPGYNDSLYAFFICTEFRDQIFHPEILRSHWADLASRQDPYLVCLYGDDWEKSCGNGFFDNKDDYASWYRTTLQNIASIPWVKPVTLADIVRNISLGLWPVDHEIHVISDTAPYIDGNGYYGMADDFYYGMTGYHDEWNHYDYWYKIWRDWVPDEINPYFDYTEKNLEQLWMDAYDELYAADGSNRLIELGRHVLAASQHETAFGSGELNWGNERLFDWQKRQSEHARYGNVFAYAASWADSVEKGAIDTTAASESRDVDNDGVSEYILYNNHLLAIFDVVGGKLQWLFGYQNNYPQLLAGNSIVFFDGNDYHTGGIESGFGDYCDYGHQYVLCDSPVSKIYDDEPFDYDLNSKSQPRSLYDLNRYDNYTYTLTLADTADGYSITAEYGPKGIKKTITLPDDGWDLVVEYETGGTPVYIYNGFTPNLLSLIETGKSLAIDETNSSYLIRNYDYPAQIGLSWNETSENINITYTQSSLFEERVEIVGKGIFGFNISAEPPSPVRIHKIHWDTPKIGHNLTIYASIYSLSGNSIDSARVYYRIHNGSWGDFRTAVMALRGDYYEATLPSWVNDIGNTISFFIAANDTAAPPHIGYSINYTISGSKPIYHTIAIDGINDFRPEELVSSDPFGDSPDPQVDCLELYAGWDREYLYLGINISSNTDLMQWDGDHPASIYIAMDLKENSGYENQSNTAYGDMWNRAITFTGSHLPDFEIHATLNKNGHYIEYSFFNSTLKRWSPGNSTGVSYTYASSDDGIFAEFAVEWDVLNKNYTIAPIINISAGVCGGNDGDSAIDSVPNDFTTVIRNGSTNEWADLDRFNTDKFAAIEWDADGDGVPDFLPVIFGINSPGNNTEVSGLVPMEINATASYLCERLDIFLNGTPVYTEYGDTNEIIASFLLDTEEFKNGPAYIEANLTISTNETYRALILLEITNKYDAAFKIDSSLNSSINFGEYDYWRVDFIYYDEYNESIPDSPVNATLDKITFTGESTAYSSLSTDEGGRGSLEIEIDTPGTYILTLESEGIYYNKASATISLTVNYVYPEPDYGPSLYIFAAIISLFGAVLVDWIIVQIRKGGIVE